jgi:hypothetical protein
VTQPPRTPDGRYIVVDGVLWRATRPDLSDAEREHEVEALMTARRTIGQTQDEAAVRAARAQVQAAKVALGERGPVWWTDGAPDLNRHRIENTPYADWWRATESERV